MRKKIKTVKNKKSLGFENRTVEHENPIPYGIIGGNGICLPAGFTSRELSVETAYGRATVDIIEQGGISVAYISRHGKKRSFPPHQINYRANISALNQLGVKHIYSSGTVGSFNKEFKPGSIVIIDDFVDFTKSRPVSFYQDGYTVCYTCMETPYCPQLQKFFSEKAVKKDLPLKGRATYVCTEGPRLETRSEAQFYKKMNWDVVGMTNVPEVLLARELGMCYCTVGIITNWATGIEAPGSPANFQDLLSSLGNQLQLTFFSVFAEEVLSPEECICSQR